MICEGDSCSNINLNGNNAENIDVQCPDSNCLNIIIYGNQSNEINTYCDNECNNIDIYATFAGDIAFECAAGSCSDISIFAEYSDHVSYSTTAAVPVKDIEIPEVPTYFSSGCPYSYGEYTHFFITYPTMHCSGTDDDILRDFVGTSEECKIKCI